MIDLGYKEDMLDKDEFLLLTIPKSQRTGNGYPTAMPTVPKGHRIFCGHTRRSKEQIYLCESLQDMQKLFDGYTKGLASNIVWYHAEDPSSAPPKKKKS